MDITFSLTESYGIHPILQCRARGNTTFTSAVTARAVGVAISVFAAIDAVAHLGVGLYKIRSAEGLEHLRQSGRFAGIAVIGSVAAFVWPDVVRHFIYSKPYPGVGISKEGEALVQTLGSSQLSEEDSKNVWNSSSLLAKHEFVQLFTNSPDQSAVRQRMKKIVYRTMPQVNNGKKLQWLSTEDVVKQINTFSGVDDAKYCFYYHSTPTFESLKAIIESGEVQVRHEKSYRGAFVSTQPEAMFGDYTIAFKKNIEFLSPLQHGFVSDGGGYWAGFSRSIPVNADTVACIVLAQRLYLDESLYPNVEEYLSKCFKSRVIKTIGLSMADHIADQVSKCGMGIPKEWSDFEPLGSMIAKELRGDPVAEAPVQEQQVFVWSDLGLLIQAIFVLWEQVFGPRVAAQGAQQLPQQAMAN